MNKIWLIIHREFSTRVRKRTFIIMTILGPILSAGVFILPAYLATLPKDDKVIIVLDEPSLLSFDRGKSNLKFQYLPPKEFDLQSAKEFYKKTGHYGLLYVPDGGNFDPDFITKNITLYSDVDVSFSIETYISNVLEKYIQKQKLRADGVDPEVLARTKTKVSLNTINISEDEEKESMALVKMGVGYVSGFMIYFFVFIYGAQIMRGVIEEKTSRIVEVMISSVKPFQLMLGKILGLAGVALLQFLIWVLFGTGLYAIATLFILKDGMDPSIIADTKSLEGSDQLIFKITQAVDSINFPLIIGSFLFFFLFGYLLYAALFAAIGSAVDKESDTQQFMLPVSLPLIASIIVLFTAIDDPNGSIAFWFSIIPLTSPIVMMARIPFGVPVWEIALSMGLLVITFFAMTWMAGKIYRIGILMYGKKPKLKELIKWISYKG